MGIEGIDRQKKAQGCQDKQALRKGINENG
jgi:hypothetical protein